MKMSNRLNNSLNPPPGDIADPIAIVEIGCGPPLKMLSIGDDHVVDIYRASGSFEPASLMIWFHLAKQSSYAIDVGAYTGIYALVAAGANGNIKVVAVEPTKQTFSRLCLNIQINGFRMQIAPFHLAAGDRVGNCLLINHDADIYTLGSGSSVLASGDVPVSYSEEVKMLPLDNLPALAASDAHLTVFELPQIGPDMVKIDVEGYELGVLAGMRQVIKNSLPIFIIECLALDRLMAVNSCLGEFLYTPLLIDDHNISLTGDILKHSWERTRNVMFYPPSKRSVVEQISKNSGVAIRL
jgi:FkbM family methyltransferase